MYLPSLQFRTNRVKEVICPHFVFFLRRVYCLDMLSSLFVVKYLLYDGRLPVCSVYIAELTLVKSNSCESF